MCTHTQTCTQKRDSRSGAHGAYKLGGRNSHSISCIQQIISAYLYKHAARRHRNMPECICEYMWRRMACCCRTLLNRFTSRPEFEVVGWLVVGGAFGLRSVGRVRRSCVVYVDVLYRISSSVKLYIASSVRLSAAYAREHVGGCRFLCVYDVHACFWGRPTQPPPYKRQFANRSSSSSKIV